MNCTTERTARRRRPWPVALLPILLALLGVGLTDLNAAGEELCFREEFNTLDNWQPLTFPKIAAHSQYQIEPDGTGQVLKAVARGSASGLVHRATFDIRSCPIIRWRWKVSNVYPKGDARTKDGDDYPLRIYVIFKYDPAKASFSQRLKFDLFKAVQGQYPPDSSLNYIWANRVPVGRILANAFTDRAMMVVLQSGGSRANSWVTEQVDALADYRRAFGHEPPAEASLAVMSDADNTGESATAWLDFIEVGRRD